MRWMPIVILSPRWLPGVRIETEKLEATALAVLTRAVSAPSTWLGPASPRSWRMASM